MKKIKLLAILLISFFAFNMNVFAEPDASLNVSKSSVNVGDKFTVTVQLNSVAAWSINLTSTGEGEVTGCTLEDSERVNDSGNGNNTNKTFTKTCTATKKGEIVFTLTGDVTEANAADPANPTVKDISESITINIAEAPAVTPTPSVTPKPTTTPKPSTKPSTGGGTKILKNPKTATPLVVLLLLAIIWLICSTCAKSFSRNSINIIYHPFIYITKQYSVINSYFT